MHFDNSGPEILGPTRLQARQVKVGWFRKETVLVHQSLVKSGKFSAVGPMVDYDEYTYWMDTKPEWLLFQQDGDGKFTYEVKAD